MDVLLSGNKKLRLFYVLYYYHLENGQLPRQTTLIVTRASPTKAASLYPKTAALQPSGRSRDTKPRVHEPTPEWCGDVRSQMATQCPLTILRTGSSKT
jgi:hypothetical protein